MRRPHLLRAASIGAAIALTTALAGAAPEKTERVIPPGQEALLLEMLTSPEPLPGGCKLLGVEVQRTVIAARYACAGGAEVPFALSHAAEGPPGAERTERFALAAPAAPAGLVPAIVARVREREARFVWEVRTVNQSEPRRAEMGRPYRGLVLFAIFAVPLLGVWIRARAGKR